jgi:cytochrome c peroxidase
MSKTSRNHLINSAAVLGLLVAAACSGDSASRQAGAEPFVHTKQTLLQDHIDVCNADPRVTMGLVSLDICVGADLFFRETFSGNGRSCASCHPVGHNFTIDPGFIATLPADDPLFVAENDTTLADLEKPALMRQFGLILENVDGTESPTTKFVMRSVPHCFSLSTSVTAQAVPNDGTTRPPNERTGWSGDGAPNQGELRDFQTGAVFQHYTKSLNRVAGTDFVPPTSDELDKIVAFLRTIGRSNELSLGSVSLTDAGAESGRLTFITPAKRCNGCHNNAGANVAAAFNRNFDTGVERLRIASLNTLGIPFDGGFGGQGLASFNFDADKDGINDSFGNGTFNTPPLIEAADTGPFFHTNAFNTIEDAVAFYNTTAFSQSPSGNPAPNLTTTEIANLGRFLRVLNASFNAQLAIARINGVIPIITAEHNHFSDLQQTLASLALAEVNDALADLSAVSGLNASAQTDLTAAQGFLQTASTHSSHTQRLNAAQSALTSVTSANTSLGTGMAFTMGQGVLMF